MAICNIRSNDNVSFDRPDRISPSKIDTDILRQIEEMPSANGLVELWKKLLEANSLALLERKSIGERCQQDEQASFQLRVCERAAGFILERKFNVFASVAHSRNATAESDFLVKIRTEA